MSSKSRIPRRWTKTEDAILSSEAESQLSQGVLRDWSRIAAKLPGRTNKDCRKRWTKICTADLKKGAWSPEEDDKLRKAVSEIGQHWTQVAQVVGSRHADQCAKRWNHSLDPKLDHSKWTPELDELLVQAIAAYGRVWKTIGEKNFPSRSATDIKNRYLIVARRQKLLQTPASSKPTTPSFSLSDASSTMNADDKSSNAIQELDSSPASTWDLGDSEDEYSMTDQKFPEPPKAEISNLSCTEQQMWLSSPNTPGSCDFNFTHLSPMAATPGSEISVCTKDASISSFPFPDSGTNEDFNTSMHGIGLSTDVGRLNYQGWEHQDICNAPQLNCMPSLALVTGQDNRIHPGNSATPQFASHPFSFNDLSSLLPATEPIPIEPDHVYTDHTALSDWHTMEAGVDMDMDTNFDFLGQGSVDDTENLNSLEFMGIPATNSSSDFPMIQIGGESIDPSNQYLQQTSPLNTMILEDVHPDMVRDLMGVLLKSKERVKMRMYSQE